MDRDDLHPLFEQHKVPEHLREGLANYIAHGIRPGGFLENFLIGNLFSAIARADEKSLAGFRGLMTFLVCDAPPDCFGSADKVQAWMRARALEGIA